jgi:ABC-type lipoprotein export system ATPase subunit
MSLDGADYGDHGFVYTLKNVSKTFQAHENIRQKGVHVCELSLPAGKRIAILGGSGSGKTTLLSLLGGLLGPDRAKDDSSSFRYNPHGSQDIKYPYQDMLCTRWWQTSLVQRTAGFVFQDAYLLKNGPVSTNLAVPLSSARGNRWQSDVGVRLATLTRDLDRKTAIEQSPGAQNSRHGLEGKLDDLAQTLSGGQSQRIALGRAMVRDPQVILADEPTANLDPQRAIEIMELLRGWQEADVRDSHDYHPRTLIWVTHSIAHAARFADIIVVLKDGEITHVDANPGDVNAISKLLGFKVLDIELDGGRESSNHCSFTPAPANKKTSKSPGIMWRLAFAEIFNQRRMAPSWVRRVTSVGSAREQQPETRKSSGPVRLWRSGLALIALVLILFALPAELRDLVGGTADMTASAEPAPDRSGAGSFTQQYLNAFLTLDLTHARLMMILGILFLVSSIFFRSFSAVGKKFEVVSYFLILLFLAAAFQGYWISDAVMSVRLAEPELSHLVAAPHRPENLNEAAIVDFNALLISQGFNPPRASQTVDEGRGDRFVFGRLQGPPVDFRATQRSDDPLAQPVCRDSAELLAADVEFLAVDMAEPFVGHLTHLRGDSYEKLVRTPYSPEVMLSGSGIRGIFMARGTFRRVLSSLGVGTTGSISSSAYAANSGRLLLCMQIYGSSHLVEVYGVIDELPSDSLANYQILMAKQHFREFLDKRQRERFGGLLDSGGTLGDGHHKAAIYLDRTDPQSFVTRVTQISQEGIPLSSDGDHEVKNMAFSLETGFNKILKALSLGATFERIGVTAVAMIALMSGLVTFILSRIYITQNEKSLCVMRAFGVSIWRMLWLIVLQFAILVVPAMIVVGAVGFYFWPAVVPDLAEVLGTAPGKLELTPGSFLVITGAFASVIVAGSVAALIVWWFQSRWVADRLKEIG